jgi:cell division protein FtsB
MIWKTSEKRMKQKYKTKMEGHSSRTEQTEDRISELEDEMAIKEKNQRTIS